MGMKMRQQREKITKRMRNRMTIVFYLLVVLLFVFLCRGLLNDHMLDPYQLCVVSASVSSASSADSNTVQAAEEEHLHKANDVDLNDWKLILSNKTHPLDENFEVDLTPLDKDETQFADSRCADKLLAMVKAAKKDGIELYIASSYRSVKRQKVLFEKEFEAYKSRGFSDEDAYEAAAVYQAPPGTSEHGTGLAFDIVDGDWFSEHNNLNEKFEKTEAFAWLSQHAADYGLILRYPKDKVEITKYGYEPWHYRYVGEEHAKKIKEQGLCLEEYLGILD